MYSSNFKGKNLLKTSLPYCSLATILERSFPDHTKMWCIFICICMYIFIYVYIYVMQLHIFIYVYILCMYIYICIYVYIDIHSYIFAFSHIVLTCVCGQGERIGQDRVGKSVFEASVSPWSGRHFEERDLAFWGIWAVCSSDTSYIYRAHKYWALC